MYQSLVEVARSVGAHVKLWNLEVDSETGRAYFRWADAEEVLVSVADWCHHGCIHHAMDPCQGTWQSLHVTVTNNLKA